MKLKKEKKEEKKIRYPARVGEFSFKRKYTAAQAIIDVASLAAIVYIVYIIYNCALRIEEVKSFNRTDKDMSMFMWQPLLIWAVLGILIFAVSFFLILRKKKKPVKYYINKKNVVKYCNIIDTCIACIRLVLIISLWELCYLHLAAITMTPTEFSPQLIIDALLIVCIILFTRIRLRAISDTEEEANAQENKKEIVQD